MSAAREDLIVSTADALTTVDPLAVIEKTEAESLQTFFNNPINTILNQFLPDDAALWNNLFQISAQVILKPNKEESKKVGFLFGSFKVGSAETISSQSDFLALIQKFETVFNIQCEGQIRNFKLNSTPSTINSNSTSANTAVASSETIATASAANTAAADHASVLAGAISQSFVTIEFKRGNVIILEQKKLPLNQFLETIETIKRLELKLPRYSSSELAIVVIKDETEQKLIQAQTLEVLLKKYQANSADLALLHIIKNIKGKESFIDIKALVENHQANVNMLDPVTKETLLQILTQQYLNLSEESQNFDEKIPLLIKVFGYLLAKGAVENDPKDQQSPSYCLSRKFVETQKTLQKETQSNSTATVVSANANSAAIATTSTAASKEMTEDRIVPERIQKFTITCFMLLELLRISHHNRDLERILSEKSTPAAYLFKPVAICESHIDRGTFLLLSNTYADLTAKGYKALVLELPISFINLDTEIKGRSDFAEIHSARMNEMEKIHNNVLNEQLTFCRKSNVKVFAYDPQRDQIYLPLNIQLMLQSPEYSYFSDLLSPLREQGMFLKFALLSEEYQGAVLAHMGVAHGGPIRDKFKEWYLKRKGVALDLIIVLPYENESLIGLGRYILVDENSKELLTYARDLVNSGAEELPMAEEHLVASLQKFNNLTFVARTPFLLSLFKQFITKQDHSHQGNQIILEYLGDNPSNANNTAKPF